MKVKQISVFLENRAGRLNDVVKVVGNAGVNIRALSLADTSDFGILRLIVNDVDTCVAALRGAGHTVLLTDVLAVEIPDNPGGLSSVLDVAAKAEINVEYMYAFVERASEKAVVILRFENPDAAGVAFKAAGVSVLPAATVYSL